MDHYTFTILIIWIELLLLSILVCYSIRDDSRIEAEAQQDEQEQQEQEQQEQQEQEQGDELKEVNANILPTEDQLDSIEFKEFREGWEASWGVEPYESCNQQFLTNPYSPGTRLRFVNDRGYEGVVLNNSRFFMKTADGSPSSKLIDLNDWLLLANTLGGGAIPLLPECQNLIPPTQFYMDTIGSSTDCNCISPCYIPLARVPTASDVTYDTLRRRKIYD